MHLIFNCEARENREREKAKRWLLMMMMMMVVDDEHKQWKLLAEGNVKVRNCIQLWSCIRQSH